MARDTRIERTRPAPEPKQPARPLSTSERVEVLVSDVLQEVRLRIEQKQSTKKPPTKR
ncbi:MAG: hypothetical protein AB3N17_02660 [Tateyamaria sp.]